MRPNTIVSQAMASYSFFLDNIDMNDFNYTQTDAEKNFSDYYIPCFDTENHSRYGYRKIFVPLVYLPIFVLGGLGNALVLVILRRYRRSRASAESFLFHLALANLLLVLTFPFGVAESLAGWAFGTPLCKVLSATNRINFYSSSLLLACVGVDRYLAVVHAVRTFRKQRALFIHLTCLAVWLVSLLLSMPDLIFKQVWTEETSNLSICHFQEDGIHGSNAWLATRFLYHIVGFFLPVAVMCYCYTTIVRVLCRSQRPQQRKAVKVAIAVTGGFLLCWSPYHVVIFLDTLSKLEVFGEDCAMKETLGSIIVGSEVVGFCHCCLNPILYAFVGIRFRHDVCHLLRDVGCLSQRALQEILGGESSTETELNISSSRYSTSPCGMTLQPMASE